MRKPQRAQSRRYWESLSDTQLLDAELETDDPTALENIVYELPPGDEEPYVEYKYDLRGTEREKFRCVHGNHPHLAGFVMRKGPWRFMVGHICGNHIYGEDFDQYTADFDAAVNRRDALRRVQEIKKAIDPFMTWLYQVAESDVFKHYNRVVRQMDEHMEWIYDNLPRAAFFDERDFKVRFPPTLFREDTDPERDFKKIASEMGNAALMLMLPPDQAVKLIGQIRSRVEMLAGRIEGAFDQLKEVEDFFQPSVLAQICELGTQYDNPKKRRYVPGLMSVTCKRDKKKTTIEMPKNYRVPDRAPIAQLRKALAGLTA